MESMHGIDVSWIHNTHNKDHHRHSNGKSTISGNVSPSRNAAKSATPIIKDVQNGAALPMNEPPTTPTHVPQRPNNIRLGSSEKLSVPNGKSGTPSPGTGRRGSWLSSISSKFSSSPVTQPSNQNGVAPAAKPSTTQEEHITRSAPKMAILQHGTRPDGLAPYTPAPPKSGQSNFLSSAFRRLSSSNAGQLSASAKLPTYGLCERRVLNVDSHRDRPRISEFKQSKLRRVAFRVDVEIAGGPRYTDEKAEERENEKKQKKKLVERGEGEALKNPGALIEEKEIDGAAKVSGEALTKEPEKEVTQAGSEDKIIGNADDADKDVNKKKEKKKRSEEERKARKEKKRKLAEANGTLPVELVLNGSDSSIGETQPDTIPSTPRTQAAPTTDPVRIYRRCCQLRETPILKKITEQLSSPQNCGIEKPGVVSKLDLNGLWLPLTDLVTLGDYLAVVPIKELLMEDCGLTDEGVRVVLAGLLAARIQDNTSRKKPKPERDSMLVHQGGVIARLVFKNNPKIGRDGWAHISLFLHMCRSIKCVDLSMIPFPPPAPANSNTNGVTNNTSANMCETFARALSERLAGSDLELLNMAETGLTTEQLGILIDAVIKSGIRRLGIAGNEIDAGGIGHICRLLKEGKCEGLDIGGIKLKDHLGLLAESIDENHPLWALSLANCDLNADDLWKLFPTLTKLKNFRFIDLSHNHDLFAVQPSALSLLRRYLPKMPTLKRIHLSDVSMTAEQAIALAEILPESPGLAHVSILDNPQLSELANAMEESQQEEACALYASLMAAVRVSKTIIAVDVDVPSAESSEVVKALAKQVVAYCLRNMERGPVAELAEASPAISEPNGNEKEVAVPDVLMHLVGHVEGFHEDHDNDEPAPDDDYVIGGTGVVKALGICLRNKSNDSRRASMDRIVSESDTGGSNTPKTVHGGKAKDMSKNLLESARKIRARLQPALVKEARFGDRNAYHRLMFLDQTLEGVIKRFEDEYPETRLPENIKSPPTLDATNSSLSDSVILDVQSSDTEPATELANSDDEDASIQPPLSRHNSDVSLASKALSQEEGRMLRFGQQLRRDFLRPETEDHAHGTSGREVFEPHLVILRGMLEGLGGEEIRVKVEEGGHEAVMHEISNQASDLRKQLMEKDPEGWQKFREAAEAADKNGNFGDGVADVRDEAANGREIVNESIIE